MNTPTAEDHRLTQILSRVELLVGEDRYRVWFSGATRLDLTSSDLHVHVANPFLQSVIGTQFGQSLARAASEVVGSEVSVQFHVTPDYFSDRTTQTAPAPAPEAPPRASGRGSRSLPGPAWDLCRYVGGPNAVALESATHLAEDAEPAYCPLFLFGPSGTGKTHLLRGLCRRFATKYPTKAWALVSGEQFTNEFVQAARFNQLDDFRRRYRKLDLLAVDDVAFVAGKVKTQEELLHTFNAIAQRGGRVVLTNIETPGNCGLTPALGNRFVSGMVCRLSEPGTEDARGIFAELMQDRRVRLDPQIIAWVGSNVRGVRQLQGLANRIAAAASVLGKQLTLAWVQRLVAEGQGGSPAPKGGSEGVISRVVATLGVEVANLGRSKSHLASIARAACVYLIRQDLKQSYPEIARSLGLKHHTTAISAYRRAMEWLAHSYPVEWSAGGRHSMTFTELVSLLREGAPETSHT